MAENHLSLEDLAGCQILISLVTTADFYKCTTNYDDSRNDDLEDLEWYDNFYYRPLVDRIDQLCVPKIIRNKLYTLIWPITCEIREWLSSRLYKADSREENVMQVWLKLKQLENIVWDGNFRINHEETARKIANSLALNENQQFRLMSYYCLEEELAARIPQKAAFEAAEIESVFRKNALLAYWQCYVENQLSVLHKCIPDGYSLPYYIVQSGEIRTKKALSYFWKQLTTEEKLRCVNVVVVGKIEPELFMLSAWNEVQLDVFYRDFVKVLRMGYLDFWSMDKFLLPMWRFLKDKLSSEEAYFMFLTIFSKLERSAKCRDIFQTMWDMSPLEIRHYVLRKRCPDTIFLRQGEYDLFICVLQQASAAFRTELIHSGEGRSTCFKFAIDHQLKRLNTFIDACCPGQAAVKYRKIFLKQEFLDLYLPQTLNDCRIAQVSEFYEAMFLTSTEKDALENATMSDHIRFIKLIREDLPDYARTRLQRKFSEIKLWKEIALNFSLRAKYVLLKEFMMGLIPNDTLPAIKQEVLSCFTTEVVHHVFIDASYSRRRRNCYRYNNYPTAVIAGWSDLMSWLCCNEDGLRKFKLSLRLDCIINKYLKRAVEARTLSKYGPNFRCIDLFLEWFFYSAEERREYKAKIITDGNYFSKFSNNSYETFYNDWCAIISSI